jgi:hypothetical protein
VIKHQWVEADKTTGLKSIIHGRKVVVEIGKGWDVHSKELGEDVFNPVGDMLSIEQHCSVGAEEQGFQDWNQEEMM